MPTAAANPQHMKKRAHWALYKSLEFFDENYHRGRIPRIIGWLLCDLYDWYVMSGFEPGDWKKNGRYLAESRYWRIMRYTRLHRCPTSQWEPVPVGGDHFCETCRERWYWFDRWVPFMEAIEQKLIKR